MICLQLAKHGFGEDYDEPCHRPQRETIRDVPGTLHHRKNQFLGIQQRAAREG